MAGIDPIMVIGKRLNSFLSAIVGSLARLKQAEYVDMYTREVRFPKKNPRYVLFLIPTLRCLYLSG